MKFVSVRDLRGRSGQLWKELGEEKDMVVTSNGKPVALLSAISEETVEESLAAVRRARAEAAVAAIQAQSVRAGKDSMSLAEINDVIAAVRKRRSR